MLSCKYVYRNLFFTQVKNWNLPHKPVPIDFPVSRCTFGDNILIVVERSNSNKMLGPTPRNWGPS